LTTILIVEDDYSLCETLAKGLRAHGYDAVSASSSNDGISLASKALPDLLIVDLDLPERSGFEVIAAVRGWSAASIIVVTDRLDESVALEALNAGADDSLAKPFGVNELLVRIRLALQRTASIGDDRVVVAEDISVDLGSRRVERNGESIYLTRTEWAMLALLVRRQGELVNAAILVEQLWGPGFAGEREHVRTLFSRLERKIDSDPSSHHLIRDASDCYGFSAF
jgi:two-component system KDP operon response regulator KdpE